MRKKGRKKNAANMLNSLNATEECDARDDRFCTGAGFIINYNRLRRLPRLATKIRFLWLFSFYCQKSVVPLMLSAKKFKTIVTLLPCTLFIITS
jgi:hypothetical protein